MKLRGGGWSFNGGIRPTSVREMFSNFRRSVVGGSALPVSDRGIGSANGNRMRFFPVQFGRARSKSLSLRSVCTARMAQMSPRTVDVAARWQCAHTIPHPLTLSDAASEGFP